MTRRTIRTAATCSAIALATALAASPASAQSFQGSSSVVFGGASVVQGSGTTNVDVTTPSAVIDWIPTDTAISNGAPIAFQDAGTTATFNGVNGDFALLNRIVPVDPTRPIIFDGNIVSQIQTGAGAVTGGTVFFYSPGGILVGANAVFDVGNLGLTTAPPVVDASGNWYTGNQVQFGQADSNSFVSIQPGAQITASQQGSYVAAFAPHIYQGGTVFTNGQAAYVAAEAGTITFSPDGLFNIQVTVGTDGQSGIGIDHSGTTTGGASTGAGDNRRIYMVAVPKNSLLTMAFERGSSVGFDVAGAADTVGNAVVLSAGHNVSGGAVDMSSRVDGGTIDINDSNTGLPGTGIDFTSAVTGEATDNVNLNVFRQTNFASNASFHADDTVNATVSAIPADSVGALSVGGNLTLSADRFTPISGAAGDAGQAFLFIDGGASADVSGTLSIRSVAVLDNDGDGVATGGTTQLYLDNGGALDVGGDLLMNASASTASVTGGLAALGGSSLALLFGASSVNVAGVTRIHAYGVAGNNNGLTGYGADGTGGYSALSVTQGSTATLNELSIAADGLGGADAGAGAGTGLGGTAQISVDGTNSTLTVQQANVTGVANNGELDMLSAEGIGGAATIAGTTAGTGTGGFVSLSGSAGATINLPSDPAGANSLFTARGYGGDVLISGATGGTGNAGEMSIALDASTLSVERLVASNTGIGGSAAITSGDVTGGDATGGNRYIHITNGSTFSGSILGGSSGAAGGYGLGAGAGGTGDGSNGLTDLLVTDSTFNVTNNSNIIGQSAGGVADDGGDAIAGQVNANFTNSTVTVASGATLSISSNAFGGTDTDGIFATGGNATGGTVNASFTNTSVSGAGTLEIAAVGQAGGAGAAGGDGTGGTARLVLDNTNVSLGDVLVTAVGAGGFIQGNANSAGAIAGAGTGGTASIDLTNSSLGATNTLTVTAEGDGGEIDAAGFANVVGGNGTGGTAYVQGVGGTTSVTAGDLRIDGSATGGTLYGGTGTGGSAVGGQGWLRSAGAGATLTVNAPVTLAADGSGHSAQSGGIGGLGTSGVVDVTTSGGAGLTINGDLTARAESEGGDGTTAGAANSGAAPNQVVLNADNGTLTINGQTFLSANALGGLGDLGGTGSGGAASAGAILALAQNGGSLTFNGSADATATATGGASTDGDAGSATGGKVEFQASSGGTLAMPGGTSLLTLEADSFGGYASGLGTGGNAAAGHAKLSTFGGTVTIAGSVSMSADASGGAGTNGGDAFGSTDSLTDVNTFIVSRGGSVSVAGTTAIGSSMSGGDGANGGTGGDATGGTVVILAGTDTSGTTGSFVTLGDVLALNDALGGNGGNGTLDPVTSNYTGAGGAGGNATGGSVEAIAQAGNGQLVINGTADLEEAGQGGSGGDGTIGGAGGNGIGGAAVAGTASGPASSDNTGSATFADVSLIAAGVGGTGGAGSTGAGGDGGDGTNGAATILVRGSPVTLNTAQLFAYGFGGDGGTGATTDGAGGDGYVGGNGGVGVLVTSRFNVPTDRGSLTANQINGVAIAFGGTGSVAGGSMLSGDSAAGVQFSGADGTIGSLSMSVVADTVAAGAVPDVVSLTDADVVVGDFSFSTPNDVVLSLDNASLDATNFFIGARSLLLPATAPTTGGTINVSGSQEIVVADGGALQTYANFNVTGPFTLTNTGDLATGNVSATGDIFIQSTNGNVATGSLSGNLVSLSAAQGLTSGPITTTGLTVSANSATLGNVTSSSFVSIDTATSFTGANIQAQSLQVNGGAVTANGLWQAGTISLTGTHLNIAATGGINAGPTGSLTIASTNTAGAFLGDGLSPGSGFTLSNAEFGRISAGQIQIGAQDFSGNPVDLTIGNLSISASQLGGANGYIDFATGDAATNTPSGRIRIDGTITATGLAATNYIEFFADSVEINAATGGIFASGPSSPSNPSAPLGGTIVFDANNIHVASDDILLRLRADPFYAGHAQDLNTPGAIDRPEGVLSAYALVFYPRQTLFIQNTGSGAMPAGFYSNITDSDIEPPGFSDPAAPDVEVIINGKFQTETGDVTGEDAYQLVVDNAESFAGFADTSQINACSLSAGSCSTFVDETPPPTNADEIHAILTEDQAQEEPFDTDDEEEDQAEEAARAPIAPPVVLIDSRPLNPDVDVTDPVSGSGNPALIGASISADAQGEQP